MEAHIIKKQTLENLPSASGIEMVDGRIYIISDDTPFLYCLDHNLKLMHTIELYPVEGFENGRIPKTSKQDLECITKIMIHSQAYLFICGSGANENREIGYLIKLPTKYNKNHIVKKIQLRELYNLLKSNREIGELNLEGAACSDQELFLLNRGNGTTDNTLLKFDLEEFIVFLTENEEMIPFPKIMKFGLPLTENRMPGFSGASIFDNKLFFTASIEETSNAIDDGKVYGSMLGYIDFENETAFRSKGVETVKEKIQEMCMIKYQDQVFAGKVESISFYEREQQSSFVALAVTDDDHGNSELLMLEVNL